jgi:hypothetical protein
MIVLLEFATVQDYAVDTTSFCPFKMRDLVGVGLMMHLSHEAVTCLIDG